MKLPRVSVLVLHHQTARAGMLMQAVRCALEQDYAGDLEVVLVDSTSPACVKIARYLPGAMTPAEPPKGERASALTVGTLRNLGCEAAAGSVIVHFDDDDWSAPCRISDQVAFLLATGAPLVGYHDMAFWDIRPKCSGCGSGREHAGSCPRSGAVTAADDYREPAMRGEAWTWHNANTKDGCGASFCYWREAWSAKPFKSTNIGEDNDFLMKHNTCRAVTCVGAKSGPRMIAAIHGMNTGSEYVHSHKQWRRVPQLDAFCRARWKDCSA